MNSSIKSLQNKHSATIHELKRYKLLVDSVQDYAIFLLDTEGYILTWNKGAQKNKGYKADEIIGKHFSIFYLSEDKEAKKPEKELQLAMQFGRAEDEDWRVRKDGSKFWASVVITALYDKGIHVGFAKVTRDLTNRKFQEDELRHANQLLKTQQDELRRLNKSKDEFISLASHQLRTPATAIKQLLGMYVDGLYGDLEERHLKVIKKAYESNDRQISIVNALLKVAQVDAGKVKLSLAKCDLDTLLNNILDDFDDTFKERHQSIDYTNTAKKHVTMVDEQNLRMCLENLISNASKYTYPYGSLQVRLLNQNDEVVIEITDNGVGIAAQDMKSLFEKFKRLPNDLSDEVGGTGLGLYWANKVVLLHGGHIEVNSELNEGSTFRVILPVGNQ